MRGDFIVGGGEQSRPWVRNHRADLVANSVAVPVDSPGRFVIFEETIPEQSCVVVKALVPYAIERTNPGTSDESFRYINPLVGNGWFAFEPLVNQGSPLDMRLNFNAPQLAIVGGVANPALNNADRQVANALTDVSDQPWRDAAVLWNNPLFTFVVPSSAKLRVIFSLLTTIHATLANPMTNIFAIGATAGPPTNKRVDFAGVLVVGEIMPENLYREIAAAEIQRRTGGG